MISQRENVEYSALSDVLEGVTRLAREGRYADAIVTIHGLRESNPRNIYLIAIQKQLEKLRDLQGRISQDQRNEILQSLPLIAARALEHSSAAVPAGRHTGAGKKERTTALEHIRLSYLQRADEYLGKDDYAHALAEVRRIYILHPGDEEAAEYEARISAILESHHPKPSAEVISRTAVVHVPPVSPPTPAVDVQLDIGEQTYLPDVEAIPSQPNNRRGLILPMVYIAVPVLCVAAYFLLSGGSDEDALRELPTGGRQVSQGAIDPVAQGSDKGEVENMDIQPPGGATSIIPPSSKGTKGAKQQSKPRAEVAAGVSQDETSSEDGELPGVSRITPLANKPNPAGNPSKPKITTGERSAKLVSVDVQHYREVAQKVKDEGVVKLRVQVSVEGRALQARVLESTNPRLNNIAVEVALRGEYSPAMMPTGPVTSWVIFPITFKK